MTKKSKKKEGKEGAADGAERSRWRGVVGYLIGGLLGLVILLGLYALLEKQPPTQVKEWPQLTILVEFESLEDPATRKDLARLQRELLKAGIAVLGPLNYPILLPRAGEPPLPKDLDALTIEELNAAKPYFTVAGWLVPRVYGPDLKSAVIRGFPKGGGRFLSGTRKKLEEVLASFAGSKLTGLRPYSYDLGLVDEDVRARINVTFGVQTANSAMISSRKTLNDAKALGELAQACGSLVASNHPRLRSVTSIHSFLQYAKAVQAGRPAAAPLRGKELDGLFELAKSCRMPQSLLSADGKRAMLMVSTDAEGDANFDICYYVAANVDANVRSVRIETRRKR